MIEHNILDRLPKEELEYLKSNPEFDKHEVKKGSSLFEEGTLGSLCILLEGYASLYRRNRQGDLRVIFVCGPGELLNETCILGGANATGAQALTNVEVLLIGQEFLKIIPDKCPALWDLILASMMSKTKRLYHQLGNESGSYAINKHLAVKIWKLVKTFGEKTDIGLHLPFEISVVMLANMLGAKRESVSREVSKMKKSGDVIMQDGDLTVPDLDGFYTKYISK